MKATDTAWRRVSTRIPVGLYEALEGMAAKRGLILTEGKGQGDAAIGRTLTAILQEEVERTAKEPTLLALAKADPDRARSLILSAFDLSKFPKLDKAMILNTIAERQRDRENVAAFEVQMQQASGKLF